MNWRCRKSNGGFGGLNLFSYFTSTSSPRLLTTGRMAEVFWDWQARCMLVSQKGKERERERGKKSREPIFSTFSLPSQLPLHDMTASLKWQRISLLGARCNEVSKSKNSLDPVKDPITYRLTKRAKEEEKTSTSGFLMLLAVLHAVNYHPISAGVVGDSPHLHHGCGIIWPLVDHYFIHNVKQRYLWRVCVTTKRTAEKPVSSNKQGGKKGERISRLCFFLLSLFLTGS